MWNHDSWLDHQAVVAEAKSHDAMFIAKWREAGRGYMRSLHMLDEVRFVETQSAEQASMLKLPTAKASTQFLDIPNKQRAWLAPSLGPSDRHSAKAHTLQATNNGTVTAMPATLPPPQPGDPYNCEDVLAMLSFDKRACWHTIHSAEDAFRQHFESQATTLSSLVNVVHRSEHPVVHGYGVVARGEIAEGTVVEDPAAVFFSGTPDVLEHPEHYIKLRSGFVKVLHVTAPGVTEVTEVYQKY